MRRAVAVAFVCAVAFANCADPSGRASVSPSSESAAPASSSSARGTPDCTEVSFATRNGESEAAQVPGARRGVGFTVVAGPGGEPDDGLGYWRILDPSGPWGSTEIYVECRRRAPTEAQDVAKSLLGGFQPKVDGTPKEAPGGWTAIMGSALSDKPDAKTFTYLVRAYVRVDRTVYCLRPFDDRSADPVKALAPCEQIRFDPDLP